MSFTVSRGLVDASHWTGMASSVASFLDKWLAEGRLDFPLPKGQFAAARRFFEYVVQGAALEGRRMPCRDIPTMSGVSSLTIAVEVLAALPWPTHATHEEVEKTAKSYLECLESFQDPQRRSGFDRNAAESLRDFLRELQRRGNRVRDAAMALSEFALA